MDSRFLLGVMKMMELNRSGHCTTLWIHYKPLKWYFFKDGDIYGMWIISQEIFKRGPGAWPLVKKQSVQGNHVRVVGGRRREKTREQMHSPFSSGWRCLLIGQTQLEVSEWANVGVLYTSQPPRQTTGGKGCRVGLEGEWKLSGHQNKRKIRIRNWGDFPGGKVVKTLPFNAGGAGLIPDLGTKIPHASLPKNQNVKQKQFCNKLIQ